MWQFSKNAMLFSASTVHLCHFLTLLGWFRCFIVSAASLMSMMCFACLITQSTSATSRDSGSWESSFGLTHCLMLGMEAIFWLGCSLCPCKILFLLRFYRENSSQLKMTEWCAVKCRKPQHWLALYQSFR